jgi:hypothetical protein
MQGVQYQLLQKAELEGSEAKGVSWLKLLVCGSIEPHAEFETAHAMNQKRRRLNFSLKMRLNTMRLAKRA